jgi:hypothetical protein
VVRFVDKDQIEQVRWRVWDLLVGRTDAVGGANHNIEFPKTFPCVLGADALLYFLKSWRGGIEWKDAGFFESRKGSKVLGNLPADKLTRRDDQNAHTLQYERRHHQDSRLS